MMISFQMAQKLKAAGLEWKPMDGDFIYLREDEWVVAGPDTMAFGLLGGVVAPRLDRMLMEIERRGHQWVLWSDGSISIAPVGECECYSRERDESISDAAASALLWILEKERDAE